MQQKVPATRMIELSKGGAAGKTLLYPSRQNSPSPETLKPWLFDMGREFAARLLMTRD